MRLSQVTKELSPDTQESVRTTGVIALDGGEELRLWVDVPHAFSDAVSVTGNPWLVAMLPMAASRGEAVQMSLPVDPLLLENIRGILAIWRAWYPEMHDVKIDCPMLSYQEPTPGKTAAFFSGGIDSYFTIARRMPGNPYGIPAVGKLDDLITVWGFDVGVHDATQFQPLAQLLGGNAKAMGFNHIIVRTNLREPHTVFRTHWGPLCFGVGLAFIGLILEARLNELVLGSSYSYGSLLPWGSHPMLDPLFSTASMKISHDGACHDRFQKTAVVAKLPAQLVSLHVCQGQLDGNCSDCEKCFRTMLALDILGHSERFSQHFDWSRYNIERIKSIIISTGGRVFYEELLLAAHTHSRPDIAHAIDYAFRRSRLLSPFVATAKWLHTIPLFWRSGALVLKQTAQRSVVPRYVQHTIRK
jgi:hypothetical protein